MALATKRAGDGTEVPIYGLGTWQMGGRHERNAANDDAADVAAIEAAIERGIAHIDTAASYADGYTESLIARAIKRFDRHSIFLASKFPRECVTAYQIVAAAEDSLQRMGVDYLDLYMPHAFNPHASLEEIASAMTSLVDRGLVRHLGVSNFGPHTLARLQGLLAHPIVANQVHYNVLVREAEQSGLLTYCQASGVLLSAWRPLSFDVSPEGQRLLEQLGAKYDKTPQQVSLNWLVSQESVVTICKTRSIEHLEQNLGALDWQMDDADIDLLRRTYPGQQAISSVVALDR